MVSFVVDMWNSRCLQATAVERCYVDMGFRGELEAGERNVEFMIYT